MISEYFNMALNSIRSAKLRSMLTMFGIIVGVTSVVTIVGLGEGVKQQVNLQTGGISESLVVVRPGKKEAPKAFSLDALRASTANSGSLSEKDWRDTEKVAGVASSVPVGVLSGIVTHNEGEYSGGSIIASTSRLPTLLNQKVEHGEFFKAEDTNRPVAVIGVDVAEQLFKENVPIGKSLRIRGKNFVVQGIFEKQSSGTFATVNVNNSIIIPFDAAKEIGGTIQILQIYVEAASPDKVTEVSAGLRTILKENHAGQEDFTIFEREEALKATNEVFYQLTIFVAGVAFISFIVGGIGIMNIMFATVSERTREIGIRKAIGATNVQILGQFVMEAVVLSFVGGLFGIIFSFLANAIIRVVSDLQPITTINVLLLVTGLSILTGILSGILPAIGAARKDPITSLRDSV